MNARSRSTHRDRHHNNHNIARHTLATLALAACCALPLGAAAEVVTVGIGTQNTTTNTVTGGIVIKELGLLEKNLPKTGKYKDITFKVEWQNFTSGPPVTNGMVANTLQIGMMGDYPLLVNGATFQAMPETKSRLIALIAYNAEGAGNGLVVHKDSPYYELADLKGKKVSVPFGSAAHGMLLKAMEDRGWKSDYFELSSQSPEVGTSSLQEMRIDGHADFVPFAELLPYRGFARKIFDGVETKVPTFHGVVVREDFAKKYPEFVVAYLKALMEANDWVRKNPVEAAAKIEQWTRVEKEVAYMFLGPSGVHTLDPTIKPKWIETVKYDHGVLQRMGRVKDFDADAWADESYIRTAYKELGLDYDKQKASLANYEISGTDPLCGGAITNPREAGEVWLDGGGITAYKSAACTLAAAGKAVAEGKKIGVAFVFDHSSKIKLFADKAYYALGGKSGKEIVPFLLKKDAEAYVAANGGKVGGYGDAVALAGR
ncbi:ABC transporter substrate-binding protein [Azoarcus indigens]|uniref:Putative aliphatic sulfonates-binding protein n=1 Tax=Azoarcus indigens TaxID=29545 RepID=A0A4R6DJW0_9RHOO|nr:ABC transporter substrate-binding protein [Azoarcus indigens]NMG66936.1 ABC transporter substrate-binding protein [Azoarcus indigens]TDN45017.1 NitT/TauT family transport system substrate-binding protein [Azoarcus indigens]